MDLPDELLTFNPGGPSSRLVIEITVINGLTTGRWILKSFSTTTGASFRARFNANGSLAGASGCNNYSGVFTAYDQQLRINMLTGSQALWADPAGIMEQEGTFLALLQQASTMTISAGQLTVYDRTGNRILVFING